MRKGLSKDMWKRSFTVFMAMILGLFAMDFGRLFYLQVIAGEEYQAKAQSQQLSDTTIAATRGAIYDRNMNVLAQSATVWNIYINPKKITDDNRDLIVEGLGDILEYEEADKEELLEAMEQQASYVEVEKKVENPVKEQVSKFISNNKLSEAMGLTQSTKRYYPYNNFASTILGFTGTDDQGLSGIESYYDNMLTGTPGRIITAKDAVQNAMPSEYETTIDAQDGSSLVLTIDQTIQYYLEQSMEDTLKDYDAKGAYGVVMDVETGAVLAMSTKPDYDLNNPWLIDYEKTRNTVDAIANEDEKKEARSNAIQSQWRNSVISDTYETGSVFKVFVAAAALEEGIVSVDDKYTCTGSITVADRIMRCHNREGHGLETFVQGLENSCNPFFITVGQKLGAEKFFQYFEAFGFTEKTGIDLPGEANSIYVEEEDLGLVELSSASFGQTNSLTPIQVVTALSAIANGGKLMQPYVVSETLDGDGNTVSKTSPTVKRQVISEETSETVLSMMESVVLNGTGKNGYVAGYSVGGKTGTSTKLSESDDGKTRYLASFAAVAPIDDPKIAVLIIIDEPNEDLGGGALAAPIAAQVIEQALQELGVEPKYTEEELKNLQIETPNLVSRDVDAAKDTLAINGLKANVVGDGDTVVRQQPAAGAKIPSGGTVVLYTETDSEDKTVEVPDFTGKTVTQVNAEAAAAGLNIQLSGKSLSENDVVSYKQSVEAGQEVEVGTVVTVYFKHTTGITDSAQ